MTHDQNPSPAQPCHCTHSSPDSDQTTLPALPFGCVPTVQRRRPSKKPGGRLPDRPDSGGCPPGFHRPPSSRLPFANLYPYIPNRTDIPGTDGALNNAALTVSALGVIYILYAWLEQAENDFVWVELNGLEVANYTVSDTDAAIGKDVTLNIESARFIDQAYNKLQAFVRRLSGPVEETTLLNIWVDTKAPGGLDPQPSTPTINENLARVRFEDPTIEAFGIITQAAAQLGIKVLIDKYPVNPLVDQVYHRKEADVIFISIGGVIVTYTVTSFEASGNAPIVITINYGTWLQVTPGVNILEWFVRDKAGNQSNGFSIPRLIQNNVGGGTGELLPEGFVVESEYDAGSDEDFIDTDSQSSDLNFEVLIRNYGWLLNDQVLVTYLGLTATGETLKHTETANVLQPNALRIYIPLPLTFAKKLAEGRLLITYERVRVGETNTPSHAVSYTMRGVPVDNRRPAPIVSGLVGGTLPVNTDPVHITVPFSGQDPSDKIDLIIEGRALDGTPVYALYTEIAGTGDIDYFLDYSSVFALLEGSSFTAYYLVNGDTARPSQSVTVQVGDVQVNLPPPTSPEAPPPGHVFDELVSKGNLKALVHPHSSIGLNDEVRIVAIGSKPGGSITTAWLKVTPTWFGSDLPFTIPRTVVLANKDGTMTLRWEVRTLPTDEPLKSTPLIVNVGAALQITECPSLLESTYVSPCLTRLNPLNVWQPLPRIVTFRAKYPMQPTDLVTLVVQGKSGLGTPVIPSKPGVPDEGHDYITFAYSSDFVAAYVGESFTAHFEVQRNGNTINSPKLTVNVDALSEQTLDLVSVPEAPGGVIDASQPNHVKVKAWPFFSRNQAVFIDLKGPPDHPLRPGKVVSADEFTAKHTLDLIPKTYLSSLSDGAQVEIITAVSLDGFSDKSSAIPLKPVEYRIERKPEIIAHLPIGSGVHQIVITPDSKKAYVSNSASNSITVINLETLSVVNTLAISLCYGIALNKEGTKLYALKATSWNNTSNYCWIYNTHNDSLATTIGLSSRFPETITISGGTNPAAFIGTLWWNQVAYIYELVKVNLQNNNIERYIQLDARVYFNGLNTSPENIIYISQNPSFPRRFDVQSNSFLTPPPLSYPIKDFAFSPIDSLGYYTAGQKLGLFDRTLNTRLDERSGFSNASGIAPHPTLKQIYVADQATNKVHVFDTSNKTLEPLSVLEGFVGPTETMVSPDGQFLLVASSSAPALSVVKL